jgi:hypothetical protein
MAKPEADSGMGGSICKICKNLIKDHSPEQFDECKRVGELKELGR